MYSVSFIEIETAQHLKLVMSRLSDLLKISVVSHEFPTTWAQFRMLELILVDSHETLTIYMLWNIMAKQVAFIHFMITFDALHMKHQFIPEHIGMDIHSWDVAWKETYTNSF